jgi:RimJ/RimL family protein N-acetyltransferase
LTLPALRVYDLPISKFSLAAPILRQAWFDEAFIEMVIEGIQPGRIFVDRLDNPSAALLCHTYEFYVAGDSRPENPLRQFIRDNPAEPDIFHTLYGYCGVGAAWEQALLADFDGLLKMIPRRNFKFRRAAPLVDWHAYLPPHAAIKRIDADLAVRVDRDFHQSISRYWGNHQAFLERSFGFCLLIDGQIASLVDVAGISSQYANLGVVTAEPYRKQGYATLVCAACVEHTLACGLLPTWDTDGPNLASAALALKLGFEEDAPFSQLSPDTGGKLPLSHGCWTSAPGDADGVVMWTRME